ncbi:MAG: tetratricopeptide repeat protein [Vicinamibacterales bacterium]
MTGRAIRAGFALTLVAMMSAARPHTQELGRITFPTSGAAAAQDAFLEGVKSLHSFQFDEAAEAFRRAQTTDPSFALAYWGEAMSYNHPLWAQQDTEAAKKALEKIAPTLEARLDRVRLPKEKALLEAADVLFSSPGDKLARDTAYADRMAEMHAKWPDDHEIATFYALSLLGTVRPGDTGFRRQALAASVAQKVYQENPKHPGAAHFIIHAFDDPDHAPLGLPAARAYAGIAPAAAHALHMPSHIFVQLGMWQDVVTSNVAAYKAAVDVNARLKLAEGREDFHTLSWLEYGNLMLGKTDDAKQNLELAKQTMERNPSSQPIRNGYLGMRARYILETAEWEKISLDSASSPRSGDAHGAMPGMAMSSYDGSTTWTFIAGVSAAMMGDHAASETAATRLGEARQKSEAGGNAYAAKAVAIMEKEVAAASRLAKGEKEAAVKLAKEAVDIELTMNAPSGPPEPIKPALELYGEMLLAAERPAEAMGVFEQSLRRTPKRTPSLLGLARAAVKAGKIATARQAYQDLASMAGARAQSPAVIEAQKFLKSSE